MIRTLREQQGNIQHYKPQRESIEETTDLLGRGNRAISNTTGDTFIPEDAKLEEKHSEVQKKKKWRKATANPTNQA